MSIEGRHTRQAIENLLREDRTFAPSPEFRATALLERRGDLRAHGVRGGLPRLLDRGGQPARLDGAVDDLYTWEAPYAKWFIGGKLNVSVNCLDRHVAAGLGERVAYSGKASRATRGPSRTPSFSTRSAASRTPSRPRRQEGRPGRHLHADDPRAAGRDAGLRPHRRAAHGRVRRLQRRCAGRPHRRRGVHAWSSPPTAATARAPPCRSRRARTRRSDGPHRSSTASS